MYDFADGRLLDREEVRQPLRRMTDDQLRRYGSAARYMCSPHANVGSSRPSRTSLSNSRKRSQSGRGGTGTARHSRGGSDAWWSDRRRWCFFERKKCARSGNRVGRDSECL